MALYKSLIVAGLVASASGAFTGGARAAPKKAAKKAAAPAKKGPGKSQGLFSSGVATAKAPKSKRSISTSKSSQTYIDVTGAAYQEVNAFVPKFDEVGVLPPLGRWDPLQIREQVCERARADAPAHRRTDTGARAVGGRCAAGRRRCDAMLVRPSLRRGGASDVIELRPSWRRAAAAQRPRQCGRLVSHGCVATCSGGDGAACTHAALSTLLHSCAMRALPSHTHTRARSVLIGAPPRCLCAAASSPLYRRSQGPERYRRFVEMEIKHGRLAMAGFLGIITTYSGVRWPGYLSKAEGIKFSDLPGGAISSWAALPTAAWFQIVLFVSICEVSPRHAAPPARHAAAPCRATPLRRTPRHQLCRRRAATAAPPARSRKACTLCMAGPVAQAGPGEGAR
jgi:hypothetical protein